MWLWQSWLIVSLIIILKFIFRGLNDKESRTQFTHVANLGGKNVYNIYAGGNHSWVVIDDVMPVRDNYRPPSPVGHDSVSPI